MKVIRVDRIRRILGSLGQPLTRLPSQSAAPISDLFVWRCSAEWRTSFEYIDLPSLFVGVKDEVAGRFATIYCFDRNGECFLRKRLDAAPLRRQTIDIGALVGSGHGDIGTFAVFHSVVPQAVTALGSFLAERGYVSYQFREGPLRAYVHGNLDAIAEVSDTQLELLGGRAFLPREYCLQYELGGGADYEIGLVNPTQAAQRFVVQLLSIRSGRELAREEGKVNSKGVATIACKVEGEDSARVVVRSRFVMARPLVFRVQNHAIDVFHG